MHAAARLIGGGVNPARAGMILTCHIIAAHVQSKPRASGDDPAGGALGLHECG